MHGLCRLRATSGKDKHKSENENGFLQNNLPEEMLRGFLDGKAYSLGIKISIINNGAKVIERVPSVCPQRQLDRCKEKIIDEVFKRVRNLNDPSHKILKKQTSLSS